MTQLKRLLDEPGSDLDRVLLEAGMDEEPPKASLDRTLVALGVGSAIGAGAIGAGGAGASLGGAKGLFGAGVAKWVGGALIASAALGGGFLFTQRSGPPQEAPAPVVAPASPEIVAQVDRARVDGTPAQAAPAGAEEVAAKPSLPSEAAPGESKTKVPATDTKTADTKTEAKAQAEPKASPPKSDAPKAGSDGAPKTEKPKPDLTAGGGSLSDELRMLDTARKALLAGDNDACLVNLAKYSGKFPKGQLVSDAQAMKASCAAKKAAATP